MRKDAPKGDGDPAKWGHEVTSQEPVRILEPHLQYNYKNNVKAY
jgi:hypothetical protein